MKPEIENLRAKSRNSKDVNVLKDEEGRAFKLILKDFSHACLPAMENSHFLAPKISHSPLIKKPRKDEFRRPRELSRNFMKNFHSEPRKLIISRKPTENPLNFRRKSENLGSSKRNSGGLQSSVDRIRRMNGRIIHKHVIYLE